MSAHATYAPSSAAIWGNCSGSVAAQAGRPDPDSAQSREGTAAHWVMSECLERARDAAAEGREYSRNCAEWLGSAAPNGVIIDGKMTDGAQVIVDDVLDLAERHGAVHRLLVEERVYMPSIHAENWGTLDVGLHLPAVACLMTWDYKHGHREAAAEGNAQLADYAMGLATKLQIDDQRTTFVGRIVQPFCYTTVGPVHEWALPMHELRPLWNQLYAKANESPTLSAGLWCRDCKALNDCPTARRFTYGAIDFANEPPALEAMTAADKAIERGILRDGYTVLKARLEAIEDDLTHGLQRGETGSGLALESTAGRLNWDKPLPVVKAMASQFGLDASVEAVCTPAQLLAKAPKALRPIVSETITHFSRRKAGTLKLTPASGTSAARAFTRK